MRLGHEADEFTCHHSGTHKRARCRNVKDTECNSAQIQLLRVTAMTLIRNAESLAFSRGTLYNFLDMSSQSDQSSNPDSNAQQLAVGL